MIVLRFGRPNAHAHVRRALRSARVERKILRAARGLKAAASVASTRNGPSRCGQGLLVDLITAPGAADVEYLATCPPTRRPRSRSRCCLVTPEVPEQIVSLRTERLKVALFACRPANLIDRGRTACFAANSFLATCAAVHESRRGCNSDGRCTTDLPSDGSSTTDADGSNGHRLLERRNWSDCLLKGSRLDTAKTNH